MKFHKYLKKSIKGDMLLCLLFTAVFFQACSQFTYKTYDESLEEQTEDPEPNYNITLNRDFQNFTNFMFIGNRIENFGTYFNTYFNSKENFDDAYEDYETRILANYSERLDSIFINPKLSQEAVDKFNKAIEKASKVIQYHKSSDFMDEAVLLIGKSYFFLGDYLKAERKFSEFISKLSKSELIDEAVLYLSKTQLRLNNISASLERLENLIKDTKNNSIKAEAYQTIAEYYIYKKDYESAIKNYKKSIELSSDNKFKAQMQYLIASVIANQDPVKGAQEYRKVLDFDVSFDLEYYSKYNYAKNLILSNDFGRSKSLLEQLKIKYKDNTVYLSEIELLKARYYQQKKEYTKALTKYKSVIADYPKTVSSADAAFYIADYYEKIMEDYLNAYRFYKLSSDENAGGHQAQQTNSKIKTFKRYFELKSIITGQEINTAYDTTAIKKDKMDKESPEEKNKGEDMGKEKGQGQSFSLNRKFIDSLLNQSTDSARIKEEKIINAKFELAELFIYELDKPDSAEYYLLDAYEQSIDYDYRSKVLFALANLYINENHTEKSNETLKRIVNEYPNSYTANESRKLLNLPLVEQNTYDYADSIYDKAENNFVNNQYEPALGGFKELIYNYNSSKHMNKSLYAAGWIYENVLLNADSAFIYYERILNDFPKSDYALLITDKVNEYKNINGNKTNNDTLSQTDSSNIFKEKIEDNTIKEKDEMLKKEELENINPSKDEKNADEMKKEEDAIENDPSKK
ncbi:MAG: tetratricopeptide repeat protein [Ignavibacteria bacterium]